MDILKNFSNEILITLVTALTGVVIYLIKNFFSHVRNEMKEVIQKIELIHIDVKSMDYAMEKADPKVYQKFRDEEKKRLLTDSNFINKG